MPLVEKISFLPADLPHLDRSSGGDAVVVPLWSDVRPLRGPTGLLDWRLNGRLSQLIREGKLEGTPGEKMLFFTTRLPWRRVLTIGLGPTAGFCDYTCRDSLAAALEALRGIGAQSVGIALPGRENDRISPEDAIRVLLGVVEQQRQLPTGTNLSAVTVIDVPAAIKEMGQVVRAFAKAAG